PKPAGSADKAVSWPRNQSVTSQTKEADANWVDLDGDGVRGGNESAFGADRFPSAVALGAPGPLAGVTGFKGDGLNAGQVRTRDVAFLEGQEYGAAGTYRELGDYFRVRVMDAASLLNLNSFKGDGLKRVLRVLGAAIDDWVTNGNPKGRYDPFPAQVVDEIAIVQENIGILSSKEQLRAVWLGIPEGERLFNLAMMFVTVNSYVDTSYRDWCEANTKVQNDTNLNPLGLTDLELWREGYTRDSQKGRDGWPAWQPESASCYGKAPVNVNTAPKPVLVCLFANLAARSRLLYFQKQDQITEADKLYKDKFGAATAPRRQNSGTTDLGRQNNRQAGPGTNKEDAWFPGGEDNKAIFQLVPIGPITTPLGGGNTTAGGRGGTDYASALAEEIIKLRQAHPFTSWQDFDERFCRRLLLGLPDERKNMNIPDLVGVARGSLTAVDVTGAFPAKLLPDAGNCEHAANPITGSDAAMSQSAFRAWYWKSMVYMIRAALNPNNVTNRYNPDYPYYQNVDRMDLTSASCPVCFSSMGIYEVTSQGELLDKEDAESEQTTSTGNGTERAPVARRQVRSVVQIYELLRHSSQQDFMSPLDATDLMKKNRTSSQPQAAVTGVAHTRYGTKSYPFSVDEMSNGSWEHGGVLPYEDAEDARGIAYSKNTQTDPAVDKWKGHNDYMSASGEFGYVALDPKDRTPVKETDGKTYPLAFHARFNEALRARTRVMDGGTVKSNIEGVNSEQQGLDDAWGHFPWESGAMFEDFISSATPRSKEHPLANPGGRQNEFDNASAGKEATVYSSLQPDGVVLRGGDLRPAAEKSTIGTYNTRGIGRWPRLKLLRYPCGARSAGNPFEPIRTYTMIGDSDQQDGVNDGKQMGAVVPPPPPGAPTPNIVETRKRLEGVALPYRGTDNHNTDAEAWRQHRSNMPYYEGTVDFWIKWDLPPQGNEPNHDVVAMGEIDPASHNFSGLFGATAYGRFHDSAKYTDPAGTNRNSDADFEGVQFFVYKEPGGLLRFSRLYFSEAFGMDVQTGATGSGSSTVVQFGTAMRRIFDQVTPFGGFSATNDICNDVGVGGSNKGFLYARTDAWVDLATATAMDSNNKSAPLRLRVHDWHRFTLSYKSNESKTPYYLWINGRMVNGITFLEDPNGDFGFRNDGAHVSPAGARDQPVPADSGAASDVSYLFFRSTSKLLEINPEDRLTVGCVFRRQRDIASDQTDYDKWFGEADDQSDLAKPSRPLFKFDSNLVAVANATVDDFRISAEPAPGGTGTIPVATMEVNSRYMAANDAEADRTYYENGFLPVRSEDGELHALPVRLGTISWTELRPDWDPYADKGMNPWDSSRIQMEWAVFDDAATLATGGAEHDFKTAAASGYAEDPVGKDVASKGYWAAGGMSLNRTVLKSGSSVGVLVYRARFRVGDNLKVNNVTPILDDVTVTVLTPPRKLSFVIDF
ncbi:MAG: hypothetical protein IT463_02760, partial [Planctomycetes bacterium]|nr:hypothetical protein [Planctomycetota bacterium]